MVQGLRFTDSVQHCSYTNTCSPYDRMQQYANAKMYLFVNILHELSDHHIIFKFLLETTNQFIDIMAIIRLIAESHILNSNDTLK